MQHGQSTRTIRPPPNRVLLKRDHIPLGNPDRIPDGKPDGIVLYLNAGFRRSCFL